MAVGGCAWRKVKTQAVPANLAALTTAATTNPTAAIISLFLLFFFFISSSIGTAETTVAVIVVLDLTSSASIKWEEPYELYALLDVDVVLLLSSTTVFGMTANATLDDVVMVPTLFWLS